MSKINPDAPAMPDPMRGTEQSFTNQTPDREPLGLTIRQELAARFYTAILSRTDTGPSIQIAKDAFTFADWFIEENNRQEEQK